MAFDIFIAALLCLVTIAMGYLGVHVTLHPPSEVRAKTKYKYLFYACAVLAVALIITQTVRNAQTQTAIRRQLADIYKNTTQPPTVTVQNTVPPAQVIINPMSTSKSKGSRSEQQQGLSGFMQIGGIYVRPGYDTLSPGHELSFNVLMVDRGSEPLHNVVGWTSIIIVDQPGLDADGKACAIYKQAIEPLRLDYSRGKLKGSEVGVGGGVWGTYSLMVHNQQEADAILHGTRRLYFFVWITWLDYEGRKGSFDDCRSMQNPDSIKLNQETLIWHFCRC